MPWAAAHKEANCKECLPSNYYHNQVKVGKQALHFLISKGAGVLTLKHAFRTMESSAVEPDVLVIHPLSWAANRICWSASPTAAITELLGDSRMLQWSTDCSIRPHRSERLFPVRHKLNNLSKYLPGCHSSFVLLFFSLSMRPVILLLPSVSFSNGKPRRNQVNSIHLKQTDKVK